MSLYGNYKNCKTSGDAEKLKKNEYNNLIDDECYMDAQVKSDQKKLRYFTTNFAGMQASGSPREPRAIDVYSGLVNGEIGGKNNNCLLKRGFGQLPYLTSPFKGDVTHGDVVIEDAIRPLVLQNAKPCLPRETDAYNRTFGVFQGTCVETPDGTKSIQDSQNGFVLGNKGIPSRYYDRYSRTNQ
jgi:hypothetical protein